MEMDQVSARPKLDGARLGRSGFGNTVVLVISSWLGLIVAAVGTLGAAAPLLVGFFTVPIFGYVFGRIGLSRSRDSVIRNTKTNVLPEDHILTRTVHALAKEFALPAMPKVGIYPDNDLNAFAAGSSPRKAVVSFSQGLLDRCTNREVLAIAAHELAHIANKDMRHMQFAVSFQNSLTWFLYFQRLKAVARWVLSTLGELMIMKMSRTREYWADAASAAVLGKEPMIEALRRLDGDPVVPSANNLAYARMMIRSKPKDWFSTHPSIADRIARLEDGSYTNRLPYRKA